MFASKPHFLDADPDYLKNVTGLHPNRSIHDSYLVIEPVRTTVNIIFQFSHKIVKNDIAKSHCLLRLTLCTLPHMIVVIVFPLQITGLTIDAAKRIQVNARVVANARASAQFRVRMHFLLFCGRIEK